VTAGSVTIAAMRGSIVALGVGLFGCGPQVAIADGDTEGGSEDAGSPTSGVSADATGPGTTPVTSVGDDVDDGTIIDDFGHRPGCGDGDVCLAPGPTVPIDGTPVGVAAGDIDGDGIDEILVSATRGPPLVVARVIGGELVLDPRDLPMDMQVPVTVGDLDDDGRADIAAAVFNPPAVVVGYGPDLDALTVPMPVDYLLSVTYARSDTGPALLLETRRPEGAALEVMVPAGNGGYELVGAASDLGTTEWGPNATSLVMPISHDSGYASASVVVMTCDFSIAWDLRLDLALGTEMPVATLAPLPEEPRAMAVADVDADGVPDLFVATPNDFARYDTTSALQFLAVVDTPAVAALATGDFDGDGIDDIAAAMRSTDEIWIGVAWTSLPGAETFLPSDASPNALAAGDFDGDGRDDLAVIDGAGALTVWLNEP
jgi:hypothetical protein